MFAQAALCLSSRACPGVENLFLMLYREYRYSIEKKNREVCGFLSYTPVSYTHLSSKVKAIIFFLGSTFGCALATAVSFWYNDGIWESFSLIYFLYSLYGMETVCFSSRWIRRLVSVSYTHLEALQLSACRKGSGRLCTGGRLRFCK